MLHSLAAPCSLHCQGSWSSILALRGRCRTQNTNCLEEIRPPLWGVSRADLAAFELEVKKLWRDGGIPDSRDHPNEFHDDAEVGPTIYQVNEFYIKPTTLEAGGTSWALMRNPGGLKCDIFATHCWAEGCFEFCHKVTLMWPRGARGLYCCFLANPQNSNISELLGEDPAHSPFAEALAASRHLLVVPNRRVSIYTRLWCVYEAHLAMKQGLSIVLPTRPSARHVSWRMLPLVLLSAGVVCAACAGSEGQFMLKTARPWTPCNLTRLLVLCLGHFAHRLPRLYLGLLCVALGLQVAYWIVHDSHVIHSIFDGTHVVQGFERLTDNVDSVCVSLTAVEFVGVMLVEESLRDEGDQLDFSTVRDARCSDLRDGQAITRTIRGSEDTIDAMIGTLKRVGKHNSVVATNLARGMSEARVKDGVMHMRGVGGCCHWVTVLSRCAASALSARRAMLVVLASRAFRVAGIAAVLGGTICLGDSATCFADTLLWSSLVAHFACEFLWYAVWGQEVQDAFMGQNSPAQALAYAAVCACCCAGGLLACARFYWCSARSEALRPPGSRSASSGDGESAWSAGSTGGEGDDGESAWSAGSTGGEGGDGESAWSAGSTGGEESADDTSVPNEVLDFI